METAQTRDAIEAYLDTPILRLELSTRLTNVLLSRGVILVRDIYDLDLKRFARTRGAGKYTVNELKKWLKEYPDPRYTQTGEVTAEYVPETTLLAHIERFLSEINDIINHLRDPGALNITVTGEPGKKQQLIMWRRPEKDV